MAFRAASHLVFCDFLIGFKTLHLEDVIKTKVAPILLESVVRTTIHSCHARDA